MNPIGKGVINPARSKSMRVAAMMAFAAALCLGLLGASRQAEAGVPARVPLDGAVANKLYGNLKDAAQDATTNTRMRAIAHLRDQVDLSTWPTNDRPGALRALRDKAATTQPAVREFLSRTDTSANIYQNYWIFNGFAVEAPVSTLRALAARDDVAYIIEDGFVTMPRDIVASTPDNPTSNWNIYQVNAPQTWALGYDGSGRTVANQDSGVDGAHQALSARWRGLAPGHGPADSWFDPFGVSPNFPTDTDVHGSHTMGTIAGYLGPNTDPNEIGQAKGAYWMAARIYDSSGKGPFSYIHACFQFMADPDGNPSTNDQPDSVGNSWGDAGAYSYPDLEWWPDIVVWRAMGIIPVFSNGNNGPGAATVGNPGSYPFSIGVGAVDTNRNIASFSSRGPAVNQAPWTDTNNWERSDWNRIKPEVVAPGVAVRSSIPGNGYANFNGTSMASPHVTGMAGILRQIRGDLTVNEFYNIIIDTAYWQPSFGTRPNNTYGWGEIDDYAAAVYVRDAGAVSVSLLDSSCSAPVVGADVRVWDNTGGPAQGVGIRKVQSNIIGGYRTILAAGTYTITVSAPGYYGVVASTTVMSSTTNTLPISLNRMPSGTVSGVVTSEGTPVAGAKVSISGVSGPSATTNAQGQYTLNKVPSGAFTIQADKCGYASDQANVTVAYPSNRTQNFSLGSPTALINDDFEDGDLNGWTVTGGSPTTGIWHNSTVRANGGTHSARAGIPISPTYSGMVNTQLTSARFDTSTAGNVWLSFDLYDSAESEYDILKAQVSTDGGATWPQSGTVFGQASPVHGWQSICLDLTAWRSITMTLRFTFASDSSNWNGEVFEGPSIDNVRLTTNSAPNATPLPAVTPTPCGAISFSDVGGSDYFYEPVRDLFCRGAISGYGDGTFKPYNNTTRGQLSKIVVLGYGMNIYTPPAPTFRDVPTTDPFYQFIETAAHAGLVSGYTCGPDCLEFRPGNNVTRAQLAKIVVLAAGWAMHNPSSATFRDVPATDPFFQVIETAYCHGIISGYDCGPGCLEYRPGNNATRGQIAKIVYLALLDCRACQ